MLKSIRPGDVFKNSHVYILFSRKGVSGTGPVSDGGLCRTILGPTKDCPIDECLVEECWSDAEPMSAKDHLEWLNMYEAVYVGNLYDKVQEI